MGSQDYGSELPFSLVFWNNSCFPKNHNIFVKTSSIPIRSRQFVHALGALQASCPRSNQLQRNRLVRFATPSLTLILYKLTTEKTVLPYFRLKQTSNRRIIYTVYNNQLVKGQRHKITLSYSFNNSSLEVQTGLKI